MTPPNLSTVYLDACPFIDFIIGRESHAEVAEVLRLAELGRLEVFTSAISYVEVRGWERGSYDDLVDADARALLDRPRILKVEVSRRVGLLARDLVRDHGLKNYDATHLASAILAGVDVLMTRDKKLLALDTVSQVKIRKPYFPGPMQPLPLPEATAN